MATVLAGGCGDTASGDFLECFFALAIGVDTGPAPKACRRMNG